MQPTSIYLILGKHRLFVSVKRCLLETKSLLVHYSYAGLTTDNNYSNLTINQFQMNILISELE